MSISSPVAAALEEISIRWIREVLGLPETIGGSLVTGATMANLSALAAARHALLHRKGWNVEEDGLFGAPPITVAVGDEVHVSVLKALSMLGLGRNRLVRIPVDGQGRMRADAIPRGTVWQGRTAMRISVSSWATTDNDVDVSLAAIVKAASGVRAR
jgi:glutamate/tyrosine decarboxylase-like PLP-dependent enzyme